MPYGIVLQWTPATVELENWSDHMNVPRGFFTEICFAFCTQNMGLGSRFGSRASL